MARLTERQACAAGLTVAAVPLLGRPTLVCASCRRMMSEGYDGSDVCARCIDASFAEHG